MRYYSQRAIKFQHENDWMLERTHLQFLKIIMLMTIVNEENSKRAKVRERKS